MLSLLIGRLWASQQGGEGCHLKGILGLPLLAMESSDSVREG